MALSQAFKDELRRRVDLSSLIGKHVKLIRRSGHMVGLCPFHQEKTPSFHVRDDEGFYHCFGCGVSGDAISFLMEYEKMGFMESARYLADLAGMEMPEQARALPGEREQNKTIGLMLEDAATFFEQSLAADAGLAARCYLDARQVTPESRKRYRLGYAPPDGLLKHLVGKGYTEEQIITAGLVKRSEHNEALFQYFRHRLIFPIADERGRVVAFGGRALTDEQQPKYLNSAESPLFHKKSILYGLREAKERIKNGKPAIVVEGYMDVIAIDQHEAAAAVAPLGTALTEEQMQRIWRSHDTPVLCFDGDEAGRNAANRTLIRLLPVLEPGKTVRVMQMPAGQDPDDLLKAEGVEGFDAAMRKATSFLDALWQGIEAEYHLAEPAQRAKFWQVMRDHTRAINNGQMRVVFNDEVEARIRAMRNALRGQHRGSSIAQTYRKGHGKIAPNIKLRLMAAILIKHPVLFLDYAEEITMLGIRDGEAKKMLDIFTSIANHAADLDGMSFRHHLLKAGVNEDEYERLLDGMRDRILYDPAGLDEDKAKQKIEEIIRLEKGTGFRRTRRKTLRENDKWMAYGAEKAEEVG